MLVHLLGFCFIVSVVLSKEVKSNTSSQLGCSAAICKQQCHRRGYRDGTCRQTAEHPCHCIGHHGQRCRTVRRCMALCEYKGSRDACITSCHRVCRHARALDDQLSYPNRSSIVSNESHGCPSLERCNHHCRSRDMSHGTCVGTRRQTCRCHATRAVEIERLMTGRREKRPSTGKVLLERCTRNDCVGLCGKKGYSRGRCDGRQFCSCFNNSLPPPEVVPVVKYDGRGYINKWGCPDVNSCAANCVQFHFVGGSCYGRQRQTCKCFVEVHGRT